MTHAQWVAMGDIFFREEKRQRDAQAGLITHVYSRFFKDLQDTLIYLLGLNLGAGSPGDKDEADTKGDVSTGDGGTSAETRPAETSPNAITPFNPLVVLLARPEMLKVLLGKEGRKENETKLNDKETGKLVDALMDIDLGDLEPVVNTGYYSSDPIERWKSPEHQALLKALGVEVVGGDVNPADPSKPK